MSLVIREMKRLMNDENLPYEKALKKATASVYALRTVEVLTARAAPKAAPRAVAPSKPFSIVTETKRLMRDEGMSYVGAVRKASLREARLRSGT